MVCLDCSLVGVSSDLAGPWFGGCRYTWVVTVHPVNFSPSPMRSTWIRRGHCLEKSGDDEIPGGRGYEYDPGIEVPTVGEAGSIPGSE